MNASRGVASAVAALIMVVAAGSPGPASAHDPDPALSGGPFPQSAPLSFRWGSGGTPPEAIRTAVNAAAADSNASRRSKAPTFGYDAAAGNTVYYGVTVPCGVNGLACFRRNVPTWYGLWLRENGHRFDWGALRWCELTGDPNGCYDAENVTLDELGHVLGLDHHVNFADDSDYADAVVQTYAHPKPMVGWDAHVFGRCDVATLQQLYDVATWSTLYSTCLDIGSKTTLTASSLGVVAGAKVTFTATLTSNGTGRLAGNPMSGRVVALQQRSGSTWTDVTAMWSGSTSGTYLANVVMSETGDFRAIFRTPTAEGVRGSASGIVTVSVAEVCLRLGCPLSAGPETR